MKTYAPVEGKGFLWGLALFIFTLAITGIPLIVSIVKGKPNIGFLVMTSFVFILCAGLFGYFMWAVSNLRYTLKDKHLVIKWAFNTKRIPLENIRGVTITVGSSSIKVIGASWPGFHLGSFSDPRGKGTVNLYATQLWGDIVLIRTKWETIGITPKDPEGFLEDLHKNLPDLKRDEVGDQIVAEQTYSPLKDKVYLGYISVSALILGGAFLHLRYKLPSLPEQVPMHYNFAGQVDRYGSPTEIYYPLGLGLVLMLLLNGVNLVVAKRNSTSVRMMGMVTLIMTLLFSIIALSMILTA